MDKDGLTKVDIQLDPTDWHGHVSESLWVEPQKDIAEGVQFLKLVNTPYFAKGLSWGDIVQAHLGKDGNRYKYDKVLGRSGHSTYRLIVHPSYEFNEYLARLKSLGCCYECTVLELPEGRKFLYALDVPPETDIYAVYSILEQGETSKSFVFEEGHVGHRLAD